jgi:hypothetical protein
MRLPAQLRQSGRWGLGSVNAELQVWAGEHPSGLALPHYSGWLSLWYRPKPLPAR